MPGWKTTDQSVEVWVSGFNGVPSASGRQFVEINAYINGTLYQDLPTTPGQTLAWSLKHRARVGTDVMRVMIGAPNGTPTQSGPNITDTTAAWGTWSGTYTVPAGQTVTRFGFQAVSTGSGSPAAGNFLDDVSFGTGPCLVSDKTVRNLTRSSGVAEVGDVLRYTLATTNGGGNPAQAAQATDAVPPGTELVPGSVRIVSGPGAGALTDASGDDRGEYAAGSVRVRLGEGATATAAGAIPANSTTSFSFDVRVTSAAANRTVRNEVRVDYVDPLLGQARTATSQTTATPVAPAADLSIAKVLDTDPVVAGRPVQYTLTAGNSGPQTATGVTLRDALPDGLSAVTASGASCTVSNQVLSCDVPDLAVGASTDITVTGTLSAAAAAGSGLTNTASVSGALTDPDRGNNTATASGAVTASADLRMAKTFAPAAPVAGTSVTYTLTTTNDGPSTARDVTITDPIDEGVTFVSATLGGDPCGFDDGVVRCAVGSLAPGQAAAATVVVVLDAAAATVQNSAVVSSSTSDPDPDDNAASAHFKAEDVADLSLTKSVSPGSVAAGETVTFSLGVTNAGPSVADDAVLVDALPEGLDLQSVTAPAGAVCEQVQPGRVECRWASLPVGQAEPVTVRAVVRPEAPAGSLTNTASVAAPAADDDTGDNSASATFGVTQSADLSISKTPVPATGVPGTSQSFSIVVRNPGPSVARGVSVTDPIPLGLLRPSTATAGCAVASAVLACDLGDLAVGEEVSVTLSGTVDPAAQGSLWNTASVTSGTADPDGDDDSTATLPLAPRADLSVTKVALDPSVPAGTDARFEVTVHNEGPSTASAVTVSEQAPAGLTVVGATPSTGSWSPLDGVWAVGTLAPGQSATMTITARTLVDGSFTNTASVASAVADPDTDDRVASASVTATPSADLSVTKTVSTDPLPQGGAVTYTLVVANAGPSTATGVILADDLPPELTGATTSSAGCTVTGQRLRCALGQLTEGSSASVQVTATVSPDAGPTVSNTATVEADTDDPDPSDDSATIETPIASSPAVELTKSDTLADTDEDGRVGAGDTVGYSFSIANTGTSNLRDVRINDPLLGGQLDCPALTGATLSPLDRVDCGPFEHTLTQAEVDAGSLANAARVDGTAPGGGTVTDDARVTTLLAGTLGLQLTKSAAAPRDADGDGRIGADDVVAYTFTVRNTGTLSLSNLMVSDPRLGGSVACDTTTLAPGDLAVCTGPDLVITQDEADAGVVRNTATAAGTAPDGTPVSDSASLSTDLQTVLAVRLDKEVVGTVDRDGDERTSVGDQVSYAFTVTNTGTVSLTNLVLDDPRLGGDVGCELPALAPGGTHRCTALGSVTRQDVAAGQVRNAATVSGRAGGTTVTSADSVTTAVSRPLVAGPGSSLPRPNGLAWTGTGLTSLWAALAMLAAGIAVGLAARRLRRSGG